MTRKTTTCPAPTAKCSSLDYLDSRAPKIDIRILSGNSKAGTTFSLPNGDTCPGKTAACVAACYVKHGRMNSLHPKNNRERNYRSCIEALKQGGASLLASHLIAAIDRANSPVIRIHDAGDFFSPAYTEAWILAIKARPGVKFYAYTRSGLIKTLQEPLLELAALPNVSLWLSADIDNWLATLTVAKQSKVWRGIAFMQGAGMEDIALHIQGSLPKTAFINFPVHGGKKANQPVHSSELRNCPAVTGQIKPDRNNPACLQCRLCI